MKQIDTADRTRTWDSRALLLSLGRNLAVASHLARILTQLSTGKGNYNTPSPLQEEGYLRLQLKRWLHSTIGTTGQQDSTQSSLPVARTRAGWMMSTVSEQNVSKSTALPGSRNLLRWMSDICRKRVLNREIGVRKGQHRSRRPRGSLRRKKKAKTQSIHDPPGEDQAQAAAAPPLRPQRRDWAGTGAGRARMDTDGVSCRLVPALRPHAPHYHHPSLGARCVTCRPQKMLPAPGPGAGCGRRGLRGWGSGEDRPARP